MIYKIFLQNQFINTKIRYSTNIKLSKMIFKRKRLYAQNFFNSSNMILSILLISFLNCKVYKHLANINNVGKILKRIDLYILFWYSQ